MRTSTPDLVPAATPAQTLTLTPTQPSAQPSAQLNLPPNPNPNPQVPPSYADLRGQEPAAAVPYAVKADAYTMSMDSAFWVANLVANLAYGNRYREVYVGGLTLASAAREAALCTRRTRAKHASLWTVLVVLLWTANLVANLASGNRCQGTAFL